ncbi:MAG TPA: ABC transporter permease [Candidatus Binatia bacterium]|nr:ABC transporter permease [Candidatus Binatia bacterium]
MSVQSVVRRMHKSRSFVEVMPIATLIVLITIMTIGSPRFLLPSNLLGLLSQSATLLVMGLGQTFIILLGSIDLSIAPVAAMATIIAAMLLPIIGYPAYGVALIYGVLAGTLTGIVHTKARIPSFIATLGAMGLWTGLGFVISNATPITVAAEDIHYTKWVTGTTFGVNNVVFIALLVLILTHILENYTRFGRYVKAIGAGEKATQVSGVNIDRYKILAFILCATLAALSGVLLSARMAGGSARMADGFLMKAIAVVILGGTAISGGVGGVLRTFIGVLIVMVLDMGMNMIGVNPWFQQAVYGAIIILAVALTIDRSRITIIK